MSNRFVPSAVGVGTSPGTGRLIVGLVALTLAGGTSFGAAPAYAATPADTLAQPGAESPAGLRTVLIAAVLILLSGAALLAVRKQRQRASAAADRRELLRAQAHIRRTPVPAANSPIATAPGEGRRQQRAIGSVDPEQAAQQLREWIEPGR